MAGVVLRVRLTGGDHIDVTYDEPDTVEQTRSLSTSSQTWRRTPECFAADMVTGSWPCTAGALPPLR
jgi:hypothetical protein